MRTSYWLAAATCAIALPAVAAACSSDPSTLGGYPGEYGHPPAAEPTATSTTSPSGTATTTAPSSTTTAPAPTGSVAPPPGVTSPDAKTDFITVVYPSLSMTCGACHAAPGLNGAPPYLASDAASAYTAVEANGFITTNSMLVQKGTHEGPALSSAQLALIQTWLGMEMQERGNQAPADLLAKLGDCIDPTLFDNIGLKNLATVPRTNENPDRCTGCDNAVCQVCHESGEYGMHSNYSQLGTQTLSALQQNGTSPQGEYLIDKYVTTNGTTLVPSTAISDWATATQAAPPYSHPMFKVTTDMQTALTAFANDIITKYNNKTCGQ